MTLNLTELRDEPLGHDPGSFPNVCGWGVCMCKFPTSMTDTEMALGDAADGEGVFKIDVDALSDEALDSPHTLTAHACGACFMPRMVKHRT